MTSEPRDAVVGPEPIDLVTLASAHTADVVDRLKHWLSSEDSRISLAAASMLLDHGWGKVDARVETTAAPVTVIRAPAVAEDAEAWLQQNAPPATTYAAKNDWPGRPKA